jgi:hypothetical protein
MSGSVPVVSGETTTAMRPISPSPITYIVIDNAVRSTMSSIDIQENDSPVFEIQRAYSQDHSIRNE